jgi:hypothetical protein
LEKDFASYCPFVVGFQSYKHYTFQFIEIKFQKVKCFQRFEDEEEGVEWEDSITDEFIHSKYDRLPSSIVVEIISGTL